MLVCSWSSLSHLVHAIQFAALGSEWDLFNAASTGPQPGFFQPLGNVRVLSASLLSSPQRQVVPMVESAAPSLSQSTLPSCDNHQYDKSNFIL